jgi:hypothetical protein
MERHTFAMEAAREFPLSRKKPNDLSLLQKEIDDPTADKSGTAGNQGSHVLTPRKAWTNDRNSSPGTGANQFTARSIHVPVTTPH